MKNYNTFIGFLIGVFGPILGCSCLVSQQTPSVLLQPGDSVVVKAEIVIDTVVDTLMFPPDTVTDTLTLPADTVWLRDTLLINTGAWNCTGILLNAGANIQDAIAANPAGTKFCLSTGVYRQQSLTPKTGNFFIGQSGTILTGGRMLTTWIQSGNLWYAPNQTQEGATFTSGQCLPGFSRCKHPEQLLVDSVLYVPVETVDSIGPGKFYFNYSADKIYLSVNPTGKTIETSVTDRAFQGSATNVTIRNIAVQMYSTAGQGTGAISGGAGWTLDSVLTRWNHGTGLRMGTRWTVRRSKSFYNGQLCVNASVTGSTADSIVYEKNEGAYCNTAGFNPGFAAGAMKFANTRWAIIRYNWIHNNAGNGIWGDLDNENILIQGNKVESNDGHGIFIEVSWSGKILDNISRFNGQDTHGDTFQAGAGVMVSATPNVEVARNTLEGNAHGILVLQQNRGSGTFGEHLGKNVWIHHNTIIQNQGNIGFKGAYETANVSTAWGNRFEFNFYTLSGTAKYFSHNGTTKTDIEWQAAGMDTSPIQRIP